MSEPARRSYAALVDPDGISLIEYRREKAGFRIVEQERDSRHHDTAAEACDRLVELLSAKRFARASLVIAMQHLGSFHHMMTLPGAADDVLRPILQREIQRVFGVSDPAFAFAAGPPVERRTADRADPATAPRMLFIGGMPQGTLETLVEKLALPNLEVRCVTVVPEAIRRASREAVGDGETTAVLVCLASGAHVGFFVSGRLELSLEPPSALAGALALDPDTILEQVERGNVYLKQQFRGAEARRLLLAAPANMQESLASQLEERFGFRVQPLMPRIASPEATVAMGAVLEAESEHPLDIYPHPPTLLERARTALRGTQGVATAAATAALVAGLWAALQITSIHNAERDVQSLRNQINTSLPTLAPIRRMVDRRAAYSEQLDIAEQVHGQRAMLAGQLASLASFAPASIHFDSLTVTRTQNGWTVSVAGEAASSSAAESVHALNQFYEALRSGSGVTAPSLDRFDYPARTVADSSAHRGDDVKIQFRVSYNAPANASPRGSR
jgi:Tfp pilus assembly protein PilN